MKEKERGGQILTRGFAGEKADGGSGGRRCCRGVGARGDELMPLGGAPGSGGHACVLEEERGDVDWLESLTELAGDSGSAKKNGGSLVALWQRG